ncbi:MAG: hypothetical protein P4M02_03785, partial [Clostridia bacterium]|nr:hypothetical protein [Clostridia bacterium]
AVRAPLNVTVWSDATLTLVPDGAGNLLALTDYAGRTALIYGGKAKFGAGIAGLKPDLLLFNEGIPSAQAKLLSPRYAVAGEATAALYSCAGLTIAGSSVYSTENGSVRFLTSGGGYLVKQEDVS